MSYVLNGEFHSDDRLSISWRDPFFNTGLGVFETLRTINGKPMFLSQHLARLKGGGETLRLETDLDLDELSNQIEHLMQASSLPEARIKICLLLAENGVDILVTAELAPAFSARTEPRGIVIQNSPFADGCDLPRTKLWNRMPYALARRSAEERGFDDAIFISPGGELTETTRANLFFVRGGVVYTPRLEEGILPGVTRAVVLALGESAKIDVREGKYPLEELLAADEVFLTGSFSGIQPVFRIEDRKLEDAPGPVTSSVIDLYERVARASIC